jgi:hypothetical protein
MSFGKKKESNQQQQSSTEALDPQIKSALLGNYADAQQRAATFQPYTGQKVAGFNSTQSAAQQGLLSLADQHVGAGLLGQATSAASSAATYKPATITGSSYNPTSAGASKAAAASIDRNGVQNVSTGPIGAGQISNYLNPYEDQVVSTSLADLDRQKRIEQLQNAATATRAHAFGGTGAAVLQSQTNDNYARQSASTAAGLRQAGYNTALQAAQTDASRQLSAAQGNQNADLSVATTNAGLLNSVNLANAQAQQQADQFNAGNTNDAARFGAEQSFSAQQANQQAGLQGVQQNVAAAGLLGQISDQQRSQAMADAGLVGQVGDARQAQTQREMDAAYQSWLDGVQLTERQQTLLNQTLGLAGDPTLTQSQGSGSGKSNEFNFDISKLIKGPV